MDESTIYQITVQGVLSERWHDWFENLTVRLELDQAGQPTTILSGPVADQSALRGILERIWDLNMTVLAVDRIELDAMREKDHE